MFTRLKGRYGTARALKFIYIYYMIYMQRKKEKLRRQCSARRKS